jgi:hypothetical protein
MFIIFLSNLALFYMFAVRLNNIFYIPRDEFLFKAGIPATAT